jgi:hypothetical protein
MALAIPRVPCTTSGVSALGRIRLSMSRTGEAPSAREAETKSISLVESTLARITRA